MNVSFDVKNSGRRRRRRGAAGLRRHDLLATGAAGRTRARRIRASPPRGRRDKHVTIRLARSSVPVLGCREPRLGDRLGQPSHLGRLIVTRPPADRHGRAPEACSRGGPRSPGDGPGRRPRLEPERQGDSDPGLHRWRTRTPRPARRSSPSRTRSRRKPGRRSRPQPPRPFNTRLIVSRRRSAAEATAPTVERRAPDDAGALRSANTSHVPSAGPKHVPRPAATRQVSGRSGINWSGGGREGSGTQGVAPPPFLVPSPVPSCGLGAAVSVSRPHI